MGFNNENLTVSLPVVELLANDFGGELSLPVVSLDAEFGGTLDADLPVVAFTGIYTNAGLWEFNGSAYNLIMFGEGQTGETGTLEKKVPVIKITGAGIQTFPTNISVPAVTTEGWGDLLKVWQATPDAETGNIPKIVLEAYGTEITDITSTDYSVWVINADTGMHSTYSSWNCNSYGKFNGTDIMCSDTGLYQVTGTDDENVNIDAKVYWCPTDFGVQLQKRIDSIYTNTRNATNFNIVLWADETEKRVIAKYDLPEVEGIHRGRVLPPIGLRAQQWKVGFENVAGSDFELTELEVVPVQSKRKLR